MKAVAYRYVAIANIVCGALAAVFVVLGAMAATLVSGSYSIFGALMLVVMGIIAASLVFTGFTHLKRPSQKSALAIAANSSVLLWIIFHRIVIASPLPDLMGQAHQLVALVVAWAAYRLILRPAALREFQS